MRLRPTTPDEQSVVAAFTVEDPVSWIDGDRYLAELSENMYRPQWSWVAEDEGKVVARALWWGQSHSEHPYALDCLHVDASVQDRAGLAAELLLAGQRAFAEQGAPRPPLYNLTLPAGWRSDEAVSAALAWRKEASVAAGLTTEVERLRLQWTPELPLPAAPTRLTFEEAGDEDFVELFRRVAQGSLDAETRKNLAAIGPEATARQELKFYQDCPGERSWWRLARTPDGQAAGLAIPSATPYNPNVGYLGVVPELRGQGLVDELLREITRSHAARGAELITATTDTTNAPMAASFARVGYRNTEIRMIFAAEADSDNPSTP